MGGVSIVRPCEGPEPSLAERLRLPESRLAGPIEMLACTSSLGDPAAAIARAAGVRVVVDRPETASFTNPKVRHLDAGLAAARHSVIVFADADAEIGGPDLDALLVALSQPGVSGVFAAPIAEEGDAWGNRLLRTALGGSLYGWPALVSLTRALGQPIPISGALVAFRRRDLPQGLAGAAHAIGDDLAISSALQARGKLTMSTRAVTCLHGAISARQAVETLRRWVFVATRHSPWRLLGFPLLFSASPLLLLQCVASMPSAGGVALAVALVGRLLAVGRIRRASLGESVRIIDLVATELLLLDAAVRAALAIMTGKELQWRKRRYKLGTGGRIMSVRGAAR